MAHPRGVSFLSHFFYSALNLWRAALFPPPILFSVCKALYILVLRRLLRSLSYFFIFLFKKLLSSPSATIFTIIRLPLGFLLSFSSLCLSLTLPQTLHSCFCLSKLHFFILHGGRSGKVGCFAIFFFSCENPGTLQSILQKYRRGDFARSFPHFQNLQQQLMDVWLILQNQQLI